MNSKKAKLLRKIAYERGLELLHQVPKGQKLDFKKLYKHIKRKHQALPWVEKASIAEAYYRKYGHKKGVKYESIS